MLDPNSSFVLTCYVIKRDISNRKVPMKKKYLIKNASSKAYTHLEYSSVLNHSQQPDLMARATHTRLTKPFPHRLKTEPPPLEASEGKSLKKREGSTNNLRKGRFILPGNK